MFAVRRPPAADQPFQLGVGQQQHQHLPAVLDAVLAQRIGQLPAGQVPAGPQRQRDRVQRGGGGSLVDAVSVAQPLADDPPYPRPGHVQQPAEVLVPHEMPGRPQHVRPQHRPVIKQPRQVRVIRIHGAAGHGPPGLTGVLRLHGQHRADHFARRGGMRPDQELAAQPPPRNVHVPHHARLPIRPTRNRLASPSDIPA